MMLVNWTLVQNPFPNIKVESEQTGAKELNTMFVVCIWFYYVLLKADVVVVMAEQHVWH